MTLTDAAIDELVVIADMGAAILNIVSGTILLGHSNPGHSLSYIHPLPGATLGMTLGRDVIAWTGKRGEWRESEDRLRHYIVESGWQLRSMNRAAERMGLGLTP